MQRGEILNWLRETDPARLADLWRLADRTRQEYVGGEVHLRGLIELSNYCVRLCGYCGLRAGNRGLRRYRMTDDEIMDCVRQAVEFGYGTVVLQSGEDPELTVRADCAAGRADQGRDAAGRHAEPGRARRRRAGRVARGRGRPLSAAVRDVEPRRCTSGFIRREPGQTRVRSASADARQRCGSLGYEVGSGVMIGIPGQTYDDLADDIELFARLDLDMIGVGPYLRHPDTPLGDREAWPDAADGSKCRPARR